MLGTRKMKNSSPPPTQNIFLKKSGGTYLFIYLDTYREGVE
jgi:hypothetical protein